MNTSSQNDDNSEYALIVKMDNVKVLTTLLSPLLLVKNQVATVGCGPDGIEFVVEEKKMAQARSFIKKELFQEYTIEDDKSLDKFRINLSILLECLNVFGSQSSSTGIQIAYQGIGSHFWIL